MTKVNTLLRQANTTTTNPLKVENERKTWRNEQNKENLNLLDLSGERQGLPNQMASAS